MQPYQPMPTYGNYPPMPQPYPDRLAQLQNQYQQLINVPQAQPVATQPQINQGLLWVQGEAGAKSYLLAPNTTVLLMDSESSRFYLKSTDGAGMPSLRMFEYTEVQQNAPQALNSHEIDLSGKYVTREEYEGFKRHYDKILERLDSVTVNSLETEQTSKTKPKAKGAISNEQSDI